MRVRARLGGWIFEPGRASTCATLLLLPLLLTLGFWQLDRARQKAELQTAFAERFQLPPTPLAEVDPADSANRYRRVIAAGRYDNAHQLLLDNQVRDGSPNPEKSTPGKCRANDAMRDRSSLSTLPSKMPPVRSSEEAVSLKTTGRSDRSRKR